MGHYFSTYTIPTQVMPQPPASGASDPVAWSKYCNDLNEYYHQVLEGMLMVYATDATPECHKRLAKELKRLNSQ